MAYRIAFFAQKVIGHKTTWHGHNDPKPVFAHNCRKKKNASHACAGVDGLVNDHGVEVIHSFGNITGPNAVKILMSNDTFHKYIVIDERVVWYGGMDVLGTIPLDSSVLRLTSGSIAARFVKTDRG